MHHKSRFPGLLGSSLQSAFDCQEQYSQQLQVNDDNVEGSYHESFLASRLHETIDEQRAGRLLIYGLMQGGSQETIMVTALCS